MFSIIYSLFFASITFMSFFVHKSFYRYFICCTIIAFSSLLLLRDVSAPADYIAYIGMYNAINYDNILHFYKGDFAFNFLLWIGNLCELSPEVFFCLLAIFFYILTCIAFRLICKNDRQYLLSLIFFSISSTGILLYINGLRQGLASVMLVFCIANFLNKNKFYFIVFCTLGFFSHDSFIVIIMIFISYFVGRRRCRLFEKRNLWLPLILLCGLFFGQFLFSRLLSVLFSGVFIAYNPENLAYAGEYTHYVKLMIGYILFLFFYYFCKMSESFKFILYIYICLLFICLLSVSFPLVSSRQFYYASFLMPILISYSIFNNLLIINVHLKALVISFCVFCYSAFVLNYPSIVINLWEQ